MADTAYDEQQVKTHLGELPGWHVQDGALHRTFETDGWSATLMLVNAIGYFAEVSDHHPDLTVSWGRVGVALSTHSAHGITARDFSLARTIDALAGWRPDTGLPGTHA